MIEENKCKRCKHAHPIISSLYPKINIQCKLSGIIRDIESNSCKKYEEDLTCHTCTHYCFIGIDDSILKNGYCASSDNLVDYYGKTCKEYKENKK